MLYVDLLGTGGMLPLPGRHLTSLLVRYQGTGILIDCGEGTQVSIREKALGFKHISVICLTHFHADHVAGLPGLLLTIGNSDRKAPVTIIGPSGLKKILDGLLVIAPYLPFDINIIETDGENNLIKIDDLRISTLAVEHDIPCLAYKIEVDRVGKFNVTKAKETELPVKFWSFLQKNEDVIYDGETYLSKDYLGKDRKGIKLVYTTDLRPSDNVVKFAKKSDLFVCEGIYGEEDKQDKALEYMHTTFKEAAHMAKAAEVDELWLTHFSPSLVKPMEYIEVAKKVYENTYIDKMKTHLIFKD